MERLESAHLKMRRAYEHLNALKDELGTFRKSNSVTLVPQRNRQRTEEWWIVRVHKPIPDAIPVIVGDCAHALRCALDHLAWALASLKGLPHKGTAFPLCGNREKFFERIKRDPANPNAFRPYTSTSGMNRVRGLRPAAKAYIERCQPYQAEHGALRSLSFLENRDKHRAINLTYVIPEYWTHNEFPGVEIKVLRYTLADGTPFARVTYDPDCTEVDVNLGLSPDVGFPATGGGAIQAENLLNHLWWEVQSIIRNSLGLFGIDVPPELTMEHIEFEHAYWDRLQEPI